MEVIYEFSISSNFRLKYENGFRARFCALLCNSRDFFDFKKRQILRTRKFLRARSCAEMDFDFLRCNLKFFQSATSWDWSMPKWKT